jgi:hypothetical protein
MENLFTWLTIEIGARKNYKKEGIYEMIEKKLPL